LRSKGFSLLEILIAFVILALVLGAIMRVFGTGARNLDASSEYLQAVGIAQSVLARTGVEEPLEPGETEGGGEGSAFRWRRTISESPVTEDQPLNIRMPVTPVTVRVEVSWTDGSHQRQMALESLRLAPAKLGQ
jgi:general secretion pathway protein I